MACRKSSKNDVKSRSTREKDPKSTKDREEEKKRDAKASKDKDAKSAKDKDGSKGRKRERAAEKEKPRARGEKEKGLAEKLPAPPQPPAPGSACMLCGEVKPRKGEAKAEAPAAAAQPPPPPQPALPPISGCTATLSNWGESGRFSALGRRATVPLCLNPNPLGLHCTASGP